MNYDELAFLNRQLAGLLRSGVPLEGALRQLTADMAGGALREEFVRLEADLKGGKPLEEALASRALPSFYVGMVRVGVQGNDLPGALTLAADYYGQMNTVWARLKGILLYPVLVLALAFVVSTVIAFGGSAFLQASGLTDAETFGGGSYVSEATLVSAWFPPVFLLLLLLALAVLLMISRVRLFARWRVPGFKEAGLAQLASGLASLLRSGVSLGEAIELMRGLEASEAMRRELGGWKERLASGRGRFMEMASGKRLVPPLFIWLVANGGEDLAAGFGQAAELYRARALYRIELMLYCVLPASILALGLMILGQAFPLVEGFVRFMRSVGGPGL